jgi:hypothetical protein
MLIILWKDNDIIHIFNNSQDNKDNLIIIKIIDRNLKQNKKRKYSIEIRWLN